MTKAIIKIIKINYNIKKAIGKTIAKATPNKNPLIKLFPNIAPQNKPITKPINESVSSVNIFSYQSTYSVRMSRAFMTYRV